MVSLYLYHKACLYLKEKETQYSSATQHSSKQPAVANGGVKASGMSLARALSPWVILIVLVGVVSIPQIAGILKGAPGNLEVITAFANQKVDLDFLSQAYTWILVASVIGIFTMGASKAQVSQALDLTARRFFSPFLTYTMFFCIAYIMYYSGGSIVAGKFVPTNLLEANMDGIIGVALAATFGAYYGFVAPIPGFIGCVIGGSETSSNIMFAKIQNVAVTSTIGADKFALAFGSLAVAGGIASAITPSKIYNACAVLGESSKTESEVMKVNTGVALVLTAVTCIMTFLFLKIGLGF
jgi:lactate permease